MEQIGLSNTELFNLCQPAKFINFTQEEEIMRGQIVIRIVDDNSMIITIDPIVEDSKTVTCAREEYGNLSEIVIAQVKQFQKQPVVDITKD